MSGDSVDTYNETLIQRIVYESLLCMYVETQQERVIRRGERLQNDLVNVKGRGEIDVWFKLDNREYFMELKADLLDISRTTDKYYGNILKKWEKGAEQSNAVLYCKSCEDTSPCKKSSSVRLELMVVMFWSWLYSSPDINQLVWLHFHRFLLMMAPNPVWRCLWRPFKTIQDKHHKFDNRKTTKHYPAFCLFLNIVD